MYEQGKKRNACNLNSPRYWTRSSPSSRTFRRCTARCWITRGTGGTRQVPDWAMLALGIGRLLDGAHSRYS
jgi:hypothetical protein